MVSIQKVIKDVGMNPIQCVHCHRTVHTNQLWPGFFRAIIALLRSGETVSIAGFGNFRATILKGRVLKSPLLKGGKTKFKDKLVMRFHASNTAKRVLNGEDLALPAVVEDGDDETATKVEEPTKGKATKKSTKADEAKARHEKEKAKKKADEKPAKAKKGKPAPEPEEDEDDEDVLDEDGGEDFDEDNDDDVEADEDSDDSDDDADEDDDEE